MKTSKFNSEHKFRFKNSTFFSNNYWFIILFLILFSSFSCATEKQSKNSDWPEISAQVKPWTRWWWMGNALDKQNITTQLEAFAKAGLGGVEITPIYGTKGYEDKFLQHLSTEWMAMLEHTISEANRLGLQVDMVMGTGWPFGGPQVEPEFAASKLSIQKYHLKAGETFNNNIVINDEKQLNLAVLQNVIYFDKNEGKVDLTPLLVDQHLNYTAATDIDLYALFCAKTRQRVKRSAPGGEGYTLDHFSKKAFEDYSQIYTSKLEKGKYQLRGIFNDSYEVYGANYSPEFLNDFELRRKYDLLDYLPLIDQKPDSEEFHRLLCDYRETLSDMLIENFTKSWTNWSHQNNYITKLQAHGSPGNLIDIYASADIPECEIFGSPYFDIPGYRRDTNNVRKGDNDKLFLKFCSSAAHLKGSELVSSESFTWLREHFKTALSQCKPVADDLMLSGVNHMFLHGSTYSPQEEQWPGWKFYASVNFNPTNTIWTDAEYLFAYIARCQSLLQVAKTDNEILIYWPIYDAYTNTNTESLLQQYSLHSIEEWMTNTSFYNIAKKLDKNGYGFDFISDKFIQQSQVKDNQIKVSENSNYKTIIVPEMEYMPLETLTKLVELKKNGASIIFMGHPKKVPGLFQYQEREEQLNQLLRANMAWITNSKSLHIQLNELGIYGEKASKSGLKILRKNIDGNKLYFVANHSGNKIDEYIPFNVKAESVLILDPMTGKTGLAKTKLDSNGTEIKIQLEPGQTIFLKTGNYQPDKANWIYLKDEASPIVLSNQWTLEFMHGGPNIPKTLKLDQLKSWTEFGSDYENFSGTAKYATTFSIENALVSGWKLNLGDVRESAKVYLNGEFIGAVFAHPFSIDLSGKIKNGENTLTVEVTNLSSNRLRALEISGIEWKKFYEINMVNIHYLPFDAKTWDIAPSGLTSQVELVPVYY